MTDTAVQKIQDCLRNIQQLVAQIATAHGKTEPTVTAINKLHEKGRENDKLSHANKLKLKTHYTAALAEAETEEALVRQALEKIYEIRSIKHERRLQAKLAGTGNKETLRRGHIMKMLLTSAQVLPLWIGATEKEKPPQLCGAIGPDPNYVAKVGDMVAALVRSPDGDDNWILAEVLRYNATAQKYELDDIDEEQKEMLTLPRRSVIPLPLLRANPETNPEALFRNDTLTLALYPQTTCFYKAIVTAVPARHDAEYEVQFEDNTYSEGYSPPLKVAQRYVIAYPTTRVPKKKLLS